MKELKDYTAEELKAELDRRQEEEWEEERERLPEKFLPYKAKCEALIHKDNVQYFHAWVNDGCEGFNYIIQYEHDTFGSTYDEDEMIAETVRHAYVVAAMEGGWEAGVENIQVDEIGGYGVELLRIDGRGRKDDE